MTRRRRPRGLVYSTATLITIDGVERTLAGWSRETGVSVEAIIKRMNLGWDVKLAITKPARRWRKKASSETSTQGDENASS